MTDGILGAEQTESYLKSAISAANGLRVELSRKLLGPLTVSPHAGLLGGVVAVYVSDDQARKLADMVRAVGRPSEPAPDPIEPGAVEIHRRTPPEALRAAARELDAHPDRYSVPMVALMLYTLAEVIDTPQLIRCGHESFWFAGGDCMVCGPANQRNYRSLT